MTARAAAHYVRDSKSTCCYCGVGCVTGGERTAVLMRAAAAAAPDPRLIAALDSIFGLDNNHTLTYEDVRRGIGRRVRVQAGCIEAVRLAGDTTAEPWLRELFENQEVVSNLGTLLLAPGARLEAKKPRGPVVCSCFGVSEREIRAFLETSAICDDPLRALQGVLKCGTNCGSCLPELKHLVGGRDMQQQASRLQASPCRLPEGDRLSER